MEKPGNTAGVALVVNPINDDVRNRGRRRLRTEAEE
jgi:hypothetical protein